MAFRPPDMIVVSRSSEQQACVHLLVRTHTFAKLTTNDGPDHVDDGGRHEICNAY